MEKISQINNKRDKDLGNFIVLNEEEGELHIFLPNTGSISKGSKKLQESILETAKNKIGPVKREKTDSEQDLSSGWPHNRIWHKYFGDKYQINTLREEIYVGAAGESEQIILAIQKGVASGVAGAITIKIIDLVKRLFQNSKSDFSHDEKIAKAEKLLQKRFKVTGELTYEEIKQDKSSTYLRVIDERGYKYELEIDAESEALLININPLQ